MKKLLVAIVVMSALLLIASGGLIAFVAAKASSEKHLALTQLKKGVSRDLHDPDSVRFRDLKLLSYKDHLESLDSFVAFVQQESVSVLKILREDPEYLLRYGIDSFILCGQLNAKNRMGAYVGYKDFVVMEVFGKPNALIENSGNKEFIFSACSHIPVVLTPMDEAVSQ